MSITLSNTRIASFTEYAVLNRWALDFLSPSECQKLPLSSSEDGSIFNTLKTTQKNPYSSPANRSYWRYADKFFLLTPLKVAYIGCVTLTISRLGAAVNGLLTIYSYITYKFTDLRNPNSPNVGRAWKKTQGYAFAFFIDLFCAGTGFLFTKLTVEFALCALHFSRVSSLMGRCNLPAGESIGSALFSLLPVFLGSAALSFGQSPSKAPKIFAKAEHRVGMFLSLALRQKLGLVDQNGSLLPFSNVDQLHCTEEPSISGLIRNIRFSETNYDTLLAHIRNAEYELIETVQKCNQYLERDKKITFEYPFNVEKITRHLQDRVKITKKTKNPGLTLATAEDSSLLSLIHRLRSLQYKIDFSREIFKAALELTWDDSYPVQIIKHVFKASVQTLDYKPPSSYLSSREYKEFFQYGHASFPETSSPLENDSNQKKFLWESVDIVPVDPSVIPRPSNTDLFQQFRYDIAFNKWISLLKEGKVIPRGKLKFEGRFKSSRELLGLSKESSYQDRAKAKRQYRVATHPDKHPDFSAATQLFQLVDNIYEKLQSKANRAS